MPTSELLLIMFEQRSTAGASSRWSATSNFSDEDAPIITSSSASVTTATRHPARAAKRWRRVLNGLTEVTQTDPTRAARLDLRSGVTTIVQSTTDRTFSSLPSTAAMALDVAARARPIALAIRTADFEPISDHVVAIARWTERKALPPHRRLAPNWVTRLPGYQSLVRVHLRRLNLDSLAPGDALRRTKQAMGAAAATARDNHMRARPTDVRTRLQCAIQAARAHELRQPRALMRAAVEWGELRSACRTTHDGLEVADEVLFCSIAGATIRAGNEATKPTCGSQSRRANTAALTTSRTATDRWERLHRQRQWLARVLPLDSDAPPAMDNGAVEQPTPDADHITDAARLAE